MPPGHGLRVLLDSPLVRPLKGTLYGATECDKDGGVHAFDVATGKRRWTYNDRTGDIQQWYVVAGGDRPAVMHRKRICALPAV
ncbi:hypothetical protein AAIB46_28880 [Streptomyces sp. 35M1]|uniref:hypothetical protein n=1 Tax=Streptomyces sp. 35M1 TaxID=3142978 RepID=UPI003990DCCF